MRPLCYEKEGYNVRISCSDLPGLPGWRCDFECGFFYN